MEAKVNGAMAVVSSVVALVGMIIAAAPTLPIEVRHMAGGFSVAGLLMLIVNTVIGIIIKK